MLLTLDLVLDLRRRNGSAVLALRGEVDVFTAPQLRDKLLFLVDSGEHSVVVDLDGLGFCDSSGLGALVGGLRLLRSREGNLKIVCTKEKILRLFRTTGLTKVFEIYDSVEGATGSPEASS